MGEGFLQMVVCAADDTPDDKIGGFCFLGREDYRF
jgi:hypothetical protein